MKPGTLLHWAHTGVFQQRLHAVPPRFLQEWVLGYPSERCLDEVVMVAFIGKGCIAMVLRTVGTDKNGLPVLKVLTKDGTGFVPYEKDCWTIV